MTNAEIARALLTLADALEASDQPGSRYRARALRNGAHAIDALTEPATELLARGELTRVRGVGAGIARRVRELLARGRMDEVETVAAAPRRRPRPHRTRPDVAPGLRLELAERELEPLVARARALPGVIAVEVAGAIRRRVDVVADAALVIVARALDVGERAIQSVEESVAVGEIVGPRVVTTRGGLRVTLHAALPEARGTALVEATGSEAHVAALGALPPCAEEESLYAALGLAWIPPELREARGEVEAARAGRLPALIRVEDLRGDLHMHTDETDGRATLEEMVDAAARLGREYIAITDHSENLRFVGGLDAERLRAQGRRIRELEDRRGGSPRILRGIEADILLDGSIDLADVVVELDWVIGSIHSHMDLPRDEQTRRMVRAIESGLIDVVGHPTGRVLGRRAAYDLELDAVIEAAARCGVALELSAYPDRLDLRDEHARRAAEGGAWIVIDTDSHATTHLAGMHHGVDVARRAWLEPRHVLNTRSFDELVAWRAPRRRLIL